MPWSTWKNSFVQLVLLNKKFKVLKASRNSVILPAFLGLSFNVYNGKTYSKLIVTKTMLNKKFGKFVFTRKQNSKFF